jgi:hypothetical protein
MRILPVHFPACGTLAVVLAFSQLSRSIPLAQNSLTDIILLTAATSDNAAALGNIQKIKRSSDDVVKLPGMDGEPADAEQVFKAWAEKWDKMDLENAYSFSIQYTSLFQRWEARSQG